MTCGIGSWICARHGANVRNRAAENRKGPGLRRGPWSEWCELNVRVEHELPRVGPEGDRVDLLLALVVDPGLDHIRGEDAAFEQERVVLLQRVQRLRQRAWHRL